MTDLHSDSTAQVNHRHYSRVQTGERPVNGKHSYERKMLALSVYAETNSQLAASERTGIPATTIHSWLQEEGSDSYIESLRSAVRAATAHKFVEASILAVDGMIDRLRNGDEHVLKDGRVISLKVKGKDCASMASVAVDKHSLLTGANAGAKAGQVLEMVAGKLMEAIASASQLPKKQATDPSTPVDNTK